MDTQTLTRSDLADSLSEKTGIARNEAAEFLEDTLELVSQVLDADGEVKLSRFGFFNVRNKTARTGRNPKTKKIAAIHARRVVTFKASNMLRDKVEKANHPKL